MKWPSRKEAPFGGLGLSQEARKVLRGEAQPSEAETRAQAVMNEKRGTRTRTRSNVPEALRQKMLARMKAPDQLVHWVRETPDKKLDRMLSAAMDHVDDMTPWERDFVYSLVTFVDNKGGMTHKQYHTLERILGKYA